MRYSTTSRSPTKSKAQRRAASVAKTLYAKDERSVDFLKAHAKRANSKTARLILSAMKNLGPRVASDKTAALGIEAVKPNLFYVSTDDGDTYGPYKEGAAENAMDALNENGVDAVVEKGSVVLKTILKPGQFQLQAISVEQQPRHHGHNGEH